MIQDRYIFEKNYVPAITLSYFTFNHLMHNRLVTIGECENSQRYLRYYEYRYDSY